MLMVGKSELHDILRFIRATCLFISDWRRVGLQLRAMRNTSSALSAESRTCSMTGVSISRVSSTRVSATG